MSSISYDQSGGQDCRFSCLATWLTRLGQRFVAETREGTILAWSLGSFVLLWMAFDTVALSPVDVRDDTGEAMVWAQHLALGYKHPPLTAWLFHLWFMVFPRTDWAAHLQNVTLVVVTLAITWRLLRDHLDKYQALLGLAALMLVPLYTVRAAELDANTVTMPFWAAALLFYLRARRKLCILDALLAGAFLSLAMLGKYWSVYLLAGMAAASLFGPGTRRFWRSGAPYLMALGATIVIAPHAYWVMSQTDSASFAYVRDTVITPDSYLTALGKSAYYLIGLLAYASGPLIILALLRPSRKAVACILWPKDEDRRQALVLFLVPLLLPALVNLIVPHRLTPLWTYPNWALLPVVLYGAHDIWVEKTAVARAGLLALAATLTLVVAAPVVAYDRLTSGDRPRGTHARQVAELAQRRLPHPIRLFWGSREVTGTLGFYIPHAHPLFTDPLSAEGRAAVAADGLLIVCRPDDAPCRDTSAALSGPGSRTSRVTFRRHFLGFAGPPSTYWITAVPPQRTGDAALGDDDSDVKPRLD